MIFETVKKWVDSLALDIESAVHANLCLALALKYDEKGETSTAAELRRTINDLKAMLGTEKEPSPLQELLKR